jgi:hypothetical protein
MPAPIDEIVKRRVIQQWLAGEARGKIIADNDIGAGTISIIVDDYKTGFDNFNLDSFRELTVEAKKRGMNSSDLASFFRLYNFFRSSGAKENEIESFITNINTGYIPPDKAIELLNQLYDVSKVEPIPIDQVTGYIKGKLQEKEKIDQDIEEADATLQSKNVSIEAINEHILLREELKKYRLSTKDIRRLLDLLVAAKEYRYSPGKIVSKLRNIKRLENKENKLKASCEALSKQADKNKEIIPLAVLIQTMHIGKNELISFKIAVNEAAELYGFPRSTAAVYVLNNLRDYNKIGALKKELSALCLQKYMLVQACERQSQSLIALAKMKGSGISEDRILQLNNLLENNGCKDMKSNSYTSIK